ncbi:hypothetical protein [uncultured Methanobrevibacter sp.]|uniref:hypothetical protein n=1 Tax=uncultured Methanobrevibacter sp. TaxID=253161 RepID=UPI0025FFE84E|nr:hypothetical protein [uncultured Methanobrevibacter sp.]
MALKTLNKIPLKNNPKINEDMIQEFIFNDPSVLGLGDLTAIQREKVQPLGGRLDILLADDDGNRYEVEIQLGSTDPSHIIRTIEYWDTEKKRYPQYDHCAVIVAEEITGRFMNVISLFNGSIPLIALQLSAFQTGDDISLVFTKIIDRIDLGTDEEEELVTTDRNYWENTKSTKHMMKLVDSIYEDLGDLISGYELKYNKFYIGLSINGVAKNFMAFRPKKKFIYIEFRGQEDVEISKTLENEGIDFSYDSRRKRYDIKISSLEEYLANRESFIQLVNNAKDYLL